MIGSAQDVSTLLAATLFLYHAPVEATANTNPGSFYVQVSGVASTDEHWATVAQFTASVVTANSEAVSGTENAGATTIECASTTGYVAGADMYFKNATLGNSEWKKIAAITATPSIIITEGLVNAQTSSTMYSGAEVFVVQLDLTAVKRLRVLFIHQGATGADCDVKAVMVTGDSIG